MKDNSIFELQLNGTLAERSVDNPLNSILGSDFETLGLDDILSSIKKAKENDQIKGIYIEATALSGAGFASLQEIRRALEDFKKSGKFVVAYADSYDEALYYVCSVASTVILNPQGMLDWHGLSAQLMFYKNTLEKLGVEMQVFKVGSYKSAVEPFINDKMSDANREQVTSYLGSLWNSMKAEVSKSRGISVVTLDTLADHYMAFATPQDYVSSKMVDKLAYKDEVKSYLKELMKCDSDATLNTLSLEDMVNVGINAPLDKSGNIIAVYYAYGEIDNAMGLSMDEGIDSKKVCKELSDLRDDNDVKAVVFRVNSPGGSAYGSEQIWREITRLKEKKPVIVSMGDYAASGGYYISCAATSIYAEPTTVTGSIGIFGIIPNPSKLLTDKLGVTFDGVKTNKLGDFGSLGRGFNADEGALMQSYINRGYELFTRRCADGRGLKQDSIKAIAQGRVWTGEQALKIGLVDKLGNLEDAVAAAASKAGIQSYSLMSYPEKQGILDQILSDKKDHYINGQIKAMLGDYYDGYTLLRNIENAYPVQALMPYKVIVK